MKRSIHFEVSGSGDTGVICVHGWGCNGDQFRGLSESLEKRFRVFRLDLPGHGRTPLNGFQPTFESYAACVVDFSLEHGMESPVLLGHSMGGVLAMMAAASGRFWPKAIINLDGGLPPAERTLADQSVVRNSLDEPDFRNKLAGMLRESFFLPHERDERCEAIIQTMCAAPEAVLRFLPEQIGSLDAGGILPQVTAPALYVGSAFPRFDAQKAAASVSNFQLKQIRDAGHFLHIYAADQVMAALDKFLNSIRSTESIR